MFAATRASAAEDGIPMPETTQSDRRSAGAGASVRVNGLEYALALPCSVEALLAHLALAGKRVAVSVNRSVVPRSRHAEARVHAGDHVEILEAVGGG